MARRGQPQGNKRQRERDKQRKKREKEARKRWRKEMRDRGLDPDAMDEMGNPLYREGYIDGVRMEGFGGDPRNQRPTFGDPQPELGEPAEPDADGESLDDAGPDSGPDSGPDAGPDEGPEGSPTRESV